MSVSQPKESGLRGLLVLATASAITILSTWQILSEDASRGEGGSPGAVRLAELENEDIDESSGLAISYRQPGCFWTHNDSGDDPRLFAFDLRGKHLGSCQLQNADSVDWEDMASFERDGKQWLLIADVGDNGRRRRSSQLYLCEEPDFGATGVQGTRIEFVYEDGPRNCESVAVDPERKVILLTSKVFGFSCQVYELPLPDGPVESPLTARAIATVPIALTVGMDLSPDRQQAIILTYGDAFLFPRQEKESWAQAFARSPQRVTLPRRKQGETICFGPDGRTVYLTSEKLPTPLWEVRLPSSPRP